MKKSKIGIAWGVWDGLHQGHLNLLEKASKKCDKLIVGVSTDELVKDKKGVKTLFPYSHRKKLVDNLKFVSDAIPQSKTYTKEKAVKKYKPDFIFVGDDWKGKGWEGESLGVPVKYIKYTEGISSTILRKDPLVSIVVPAWGTYKKYLPQCLESIKKQTYKNYEVIVVDNKTDLPSSRNEGIKKAKGEYILPLDVDDTLHPEYLSRTIEQKADIVTTASNQNGKKYLPAKNVCLEDIKKTNVVIACSLFKKKIWEELKGYDETMKTGLEDWDFWLRAMMKGYQIKVLDEILYNYNKRPDGQISTMKDKPPVIEHLRSKHIKYSVIIPTMWASDKIKEMVKVYDKCDYISEVLIINNKPEDSLKLKSKKIREIYKGENIYVNPAWNLGVREAKEENIIIANDDVYFENLRELLNIVNLKDKMLIGADISSYKQKGIKYEGAIKVEPVNVMNWGYGTFMIMKKNSYQSVPEHLLIWEGDTIQFQVNDSYVFKGIDIETEMSETIKKFNLRNKAFEDLKKGMIPKTKEGNISKDVTFIIKTFKRYKCLERLLFSIRKYYPQNKLIIADDNSDTEFNAYLYLKWKKRLNIEVLRLSYDTGLSYGRNKMVEATKTPFILLLDDDFVFNEETRIDKFYKVLKSDINIGLVGGSCLEGVKKVHYECSLELKDGVLKQVPDGDNWENIEGIKAKQTGCVLNFFLARKKCLTENKWCDKLKVAEHTDYFLNFKNWKIYYTPEVSIIHDKERDNNYMEFRGRGEDYTIEMFKKNKIKKMISITGAVKELEGNTIKKYKIFN